MLLDDRCGIVNVHGEHCRSTDQAFNNVPLSEIFKIEDRSFLDDLSTVIWYKAI